jgi:hypothetical protein
VVVVTGGRRIRKGKRVGRRWGRVKAGPLVKRNVVVVSPIFREDRARIVLVMVLACVVVVVWVVVKLGVLNRERGVTRSGPVVRSLRLL